MEAATKGRDLFKDSQTLCKGQLLIGELFVRFFGEFRVHLGEIFVRPPLHVKWRQEGVPVARFLSNLA